MNKIVFRLCCTTAGVVILVIPVLGFLYGRHKLRQYSGKRNYLKDIYPARNPQACSSCGGTAVELFYSKTSYRYLCKDQRLCELTSIYRAMLANVESA